MGFPIVFLSDLRIVVIIYYNNLGFVYIDFALYLPGGVNESNLTMLYRKGVRIMRNRSYYFSLAIAFFVAILLSAWNVVVAEDLENGLILHVDFETEEPVDLSPDPTEISVFAGDLKQDEGKVGKAGVFDGTVLEVSDAPKLSGMEALTIAAWINPAKSIEVSIVSKRAVQGNGDTYNFFLWTGNRLSGRINNNGDFFSTTVFGTGEWYHVAFVFDGGDGSEKIYVNGELDAEAVNYPA